MLARASRPPCAAPRAPAVAARAPSARPPAAAPRRHFASAPAPRHDQRSSAIGAAPRRPHYGGARSGLFGGPAQDRSVFVEAAPAAWLRCASRLDVGTARELGGMSGAPHFNAELCSE